ncbi:hypothetical protein [Hyphomonas sp.]|uniref:hypothetical protein n=1 Tax=Hyphomonas sp. TaxID=87 RepID=UPI0025C1FA5E|nr:hypothetical protein [Hyphomonas sp.]
MIRTIQKGLLADGFRVSIAKLCSGFDVPRWTFYYKPLKSAHKVDARFETPIKDLIEKEPSFGYRTVAWLPGFNSEPRAANGSRRRGEHGAADLPDQGLAGPQATDRHAPPNPGAALCGQSA